MSSCALSSGIALIAASQGVLGCALPPRQVGVTIRVASSPPGALVLLSRSAPFDEKTAIAVGRTPLLRWTAMPESAEWRVELSRRGCAAWEGPITAASPSVEAELACPGPDSLPGREPITLLRVRLVVADIHEYGTSQPIDESGEAMFRSMVSAELESALAERHGHRVVFEDVRSDKTRDDWRRLRKKLHALRGDKLPYYTEAPHLRAGLPLLEDLEDPGEAVLLVEIAGAVLSTGQKLERAGIPAAASIGALLQGPAIVPLYTPGPRPDHLYARLLAVRGRNREVLLLEELHERGIPTETRSGSALARQIAIAIPRGWFAAE